MDFFMSWGPGLTALLGAGALFWTIGNSVRKDSKAEVADLRDSTDRKISALVDSIADLRAENSKANADLRAELRDSIADLRAETSKANGELRDSIADLRAETSKANAELRAETSKANGELRDSIADLREITAKNSADIANLRESIARTEMIVGKNADKIDAFIAALAKQH